MQSSGALSATAILPVVCGAHVGSSVTVLLAGFSGRQNARKLGVCTFVYKFLGILFLLPFFPWLQGFMASGGGLAAKVVQSAGGRYPFQRACLLSVYGHPRALFLHESPNRPVESVLGAPVYLDDELTDVPSLAILLLSKEMIRLANYIEMYCQVLFASGEEPRRIRGTSPRHTRTLGSLPGVHV